MNKIAILFAILAVASAAVQTNTPSSAFAIAPGKVFTNVTDTAFTGLTGPCIFNGGFDNTTNYVWCQTAAATATVPYTFQRRGINASSPGTVNSTMDTKLATTHMLRAEGTAYCAGPGYFGFASDAVASGVYNLYFSYAAVNASSFTKVALTANTVAGLYADPQQCMFDNGIFYIVYKSYVDANNTLNSVYVQAVNVTSGAVYYNSTGGVKLFDYTAQALSYIEITGLVGNNKTGSATSGLLLYTNSYSATPASVLSSYNVLPFTLATGAAGSLQTLATGSKTTASQSSATFTSTSTFTISTSTTGSTTFTTTIYIPQTTNVASSTLTLEATTATTTTITTDTTILNVGTTSYTTQYGTTLVSITASGSVEYTYFSTTSTSTNTATTTTLPLLLTSLSLSTTVTSGAVLSSTITTTYMLSAFGSLSTYGVVLVQDVATTSAQQSDSDVAHVYTNSFFYNGSTTASTNTNFTNPSGYYLSSVSGFSTSDGYVLIENMESTTSGSDAYYLDQYFYNGTNKVTATSLGTFGSGLQSFPDATGSIWGGYAVYDRDLSLPLSAGYAGEILYVAGASTLSSIFAALALMIAALFAF